MQSPFCSHCLQLNASNQNGWSISISNEFRVDSDVFNLLTHALQSWWGELDRFKQKEHTWAFFFSSTWSFLDWVTTEIIFQPMNQSCWKASTSSEGGKTAEWKEAKRRVEPHLLEGEKARHQPRDCLLCDVSTIYKPVWVWSFHSVVADHESVIASSLLCRFLTAWLSFDSLRFPATMLVFVFLAPWNLDQFQCLPIFPFSLSFCFFVFFDWVELTAYSSGNVKTFTCLYLPICRSAGPDRCIFYQLCFSFAFFFFQSNFQHSCELQCSKRPINLTCLIIKRSSRSIRHDVGDMQFFLPHSFSSITGRFRGTVTENQASRACHFCWLLKFTRRRKDVKLDRLGLWRRRRSYSPVSE